MSGPPYMPFYVGDYLADTVHLTTTEHGAYLLLLMAMWRAGGSLPNDDRYLSRAAHLSSVQWGRVRPTILAFFDVQPDQITHRRLSTEWTKYEAAVQQRRVAGSNGGKANALKYNKSGVAGAYRSLKQPKPEPIYISLEGNRFAEESLRQEAVQLMGEPWVRSYLDPSKWVKTDLSIVARNRLSSDALSSALRGVLRGRGVVVRYVGSADPSAPVTGDPGGAGASGAGALDNVSGDGPQS